MMRNGMKKKIVLITLVAVMCTSGVVHVLAEDNSARIAEIKAQIAALQAELDELTSTSGEETGEKVSWIISNYVDKFNRPTEERYIINEYYILGTFSNSATTNSDLKVSLLIDADNVRIKLYEYGDNLVKNYYSKNKHYTLSALDTYGEEYTLSCYIKPEDHYLCVTDKDVFCRLLEQEGQVSFVIDEDDGMSEYEFTVNFPSGFTELYSEIGGSFQSNEE